MDDFKDHPKSINEARAEKSGKGSDWTPRDVLIDLLRRIDSGETEVNVIVVMYGTISEDGVVRSGYSQSSRNTFEARGLIEYTKTRFIANELEVIHGTHG